MKKINIIQFTPYFPPHKGGLETVAEEIGKYWVKNKNGYFVNITFSVGQKEIASEYVKNGYQVFVIPAFDIVPNFPIPKFWTQDFWLIFKKIKNIIGNQNKNFRVVTHTRFFVSSLLGGVLALIYKLKWVHLEHGSGYVKLNSCLQSKVAYIYDILIGKWIFKNAYRVLVISSACRAFVQKEFVKRDVEVFFRGLDLPKGGKKKHGDISIIFVGRLVGLKGVEDLIEAYKKLNVKNELIIIGDGEEKSVLKRQAGKGNNISFLGFQDRDFVLEYLSTNNCVLVNPSYQEGMPTTVLEALFYENVVVASNVGGTTEISEESDLLLFQAGDISSLCNCIQAALNGYSSLIGKSKSSIIKRFSRDKNILRFYDFIQ